MALVEVTITGTGLTGPFGAEVTAMRGELRGLVRPSLQRLRRLWRRNVRRRTGRLARHGRIVMAQGAGRTGGRLVIDPPHMNPLWEEEDTRPHAIVAKPGKVLRFVGRQGVTFRKRVWHPGTRGSHALARAGRLNERLTRLEAQRILAKKRTI